MDALLNLMIKIKMWGRVWRQLFREQVRRRMEEPLVRPTEVSQLPEHSAVCGGGGQAAFPKFTPPAGPP